MLINFKIPSIHKLILLILWVKIKILAPTLINFKIPRYFEYIFGNLIPGMKIKIVQFYKLLYSNLC